MEVQPRARARADLWREDTLDSACRAWGRITKKTHGHRPDSWLCSGAERQHWTWVWGDSPKQQEHECDSQPGLGRRDYTGGGIWGTSPRELLGLLAGSPRSGADSRRSSFTGVTPSSIWGCECLKDSLQPLRHRSELLGSGIC